MKKNTIVSIEQDVVKDIKANRKKRIKGSLFVNSDGHVDFEAVTKKAHELGIRRFVTEMWYTGNESWKEDILTACSGMKKIIDRNFN